MNVSCSLCLSNFYWTHIFLQFRLESLRGSGSVETSLGNAAHYALYGFMGIMPISGIAMGYYGGKGLPFFSTSFAGVVHTDETKKANLAIAKQVCV
jgi:cytochrome b561